MLMKPAICCKCGKNLKGWVPIDAKEVTCFKCSEAEYKERDRNERRQRSTDRPPTS